MSFTSYPTVIHSPRFYPPMQIVDWEKRDLDDMSLDDFVFLLMQDRRSFHDEAQWLEACKGDPKDLEVRTSRSYTARARRDSQ